MITNEELRISNESYTSKDFLSIYPELLGIIKKISPKWDPSNSNESDPGNVLLKAMAFLADKINYNTDKNVLENFVPSVTQETSARNLFEAAGYYPKYYRSAITNVRFRYTGTSLLTGDSFTFPAMTTVVSDEDSTVSFSLMRSVKINASRVTTEPVRAIQGVFATLTVGTGNIIQLSDLDDNNRIYLPESMVAQNGVFIYNSEMFSEGSTEADNSTRDDSTWRLVDNLNLEEPSDTNHVFKVGYDSDRGLPYVEFPDNISSLIGSGLIIKYVKTSGANGNVSANFLSRLSSPMQVTTASGVTISFDSSSDEAADAILVYNTSSTVGGSDPESIDESYNGFKKTVGTFDTLVTCRDYANAVYGMLDESTSMPYVSNIQVADRRSDINYGNSIVSYSPLGKNILIDTDEADITPFDLCMYPLMPINQVYDYESYVNSFKPLVETQYYESAIEGLKTLSHTYKELEQDDVYAIKNYYRLNALITTTYKVDEYEQYAITQAIRTALYKRFNARNVDYGYELPDVIRETILSASPTIKNVDLGQTYIDSVVMYSDGTERSLLEMINTGGVEVRDRYITVLAKNILAGRLSMFDYDTDFDYDFGQFPAVVEQVQVPSKVDNLVSIKTEVPITTDADGLNYTLRDNEVIQCIAPNLVSRITYPAYCNFRFECGGDDTATIPANEEHLVSGDEVLYINRMDANKNVINTIYTKDGITTNGVLKRMDAVYVKPNFTITVTKPYSQSGRTTVKKSVDGDELDFYTLSTNEQIEEREIVARVLSDTQIFCYWSTKRNNNILFTEDDAVKDSGGQTLYYETLLGEGEYFAYCDDAKTEVVIRGSGTKLIYDYSGELIPGSWECQNGPIEELAEGGVSVFEAFNWKIKNFGTYSLEIHDMQILTLSSGDNITIQADNWHNVVSDDEYVEGTKYYTYKNDVYTYRPNIDSKSDLQAAIAAASSDGPVYRKVIEDIGNDFQKVDQSLVISYTMAGETSQNHLPQFSNDMMAWRIRSRLDIDSGPDMPQAVLGADSEKTGNESVHRFELTYVGGQNPVVVTNDGSNNTYISLSKLVQSAGGNNVDMSVTVISPSGMTQEYSLSAFVYNYEAPKYTISYNGSPQEVTMERVGGYYSIPISSLYDVDVDGASITLKMLGIGSERTLIMFYSYGDQGTSYEVELVSSGNNKSVRFYNSDDPSFKQRVRLSYDYVLATEYDPNVDYYYYYESGTDRYIIDGDVVDDASFADESTAHGGLFVEVIRSEKLSIVEVNPNETELTINAIKTVGADDSSMHLIVGGVSKVKVRGGGLHMNAGFGLSSDEESALLDRIKSLDSDGVFYYNNPIDKGSAINVRDTSSPQFFWDKNNLYNKFTLGEIDFANSSFRVVSSSQA